jgi:hypothetical protein
LTLERRGVSNLRQTDPKMTVPARASSNCKQQTQPPTREGALHQQACSCLRVIKIRSLIENCSGMEHLNLYTSIADYIKINDIINTDIININLRQEVQFKNIYHQTKLQSPPLDGTKCAQLRILHDYFILVFMEIRMTVCPINS